MFIKKQYYFIITFFFLLSAFRSDMPAYQLYNQKGKRTTFKKLIKEAAQADIVFFGESHNNPISHWLQLELTQALHQIHGNQLVLGAEMIETDNQAALNQYLANQIDADSLKASARLWPNYPTDYKPLVEFAKTNKLLFIGTNVPRRYASMVFRGGFEVLDTLPDTDKQWIAPLPIDYDPNLPSYLEMIEMMGDMKNHGSANFPKAQAIKDATMAYNIAKNWNKGQYFIHYNGSYHSDDYEGIVWYLKRLKPEAKILTITTIESAEIERRLSKEQGLVADFTIAVPENMTKTY
ncbi:MAG: ChaN family lipoprotein [Bacteroidales bacterium]|jgi:uncharacterized iron-regulated protein|nr:ChaN family lipoprotein [Bacteroidales bacterium]